MVLPSELKLPGQNMRREHTSISLRKQPGRKGGSLVLKRLGPSWFYGLEGFWEKRGALGRDKKYRCMNKMHLLLDAKEITGQSREEMRKSRIWRSQHHWLKGHKSECVLQSMRSWRVGPNLANEQQKKFGEETDRSTLKIYARRFHGVRNWQWILNSIHWCTIPDTASTAPSSQSHSSGVTLLKEKQMPGACGRDWERQWAQVFGGCYPEKNEVLLALKEF